MLFLNGSCYALFHLGNEGTDEDGATRGGTEALAVVGLLLVFSPTATAVDGHHGALEQIQIAYCVETNPRHVDASVDGEEAAVLPFDKQAARVVAHVCHHVVQLSLASEDAVVEALVKERDVGEAFGRPKGRLTGQPICIAGVVLCRGLQVAKRSCRLAAGLLPCRHHIPQRQLFRQTFGHMEHQVHMVGHYLVLHHFHLRVTLRQFLYLMPYGLADGAELYPSPRGITFHQPQQGLSVHRRHRDKVDAWLVVVVPVAALEFGVDCCLQ